MLWNDLLERIGFKKKPAPPPPLPEPAGPLDLTQGFFMGYSPNDVQVTYNNDVNNIFVDVNFPSGTIFRFNCDGRCVAQITRDGFMGGDGKPL